MTTDFNDFELDISDIYLSRKKKCVNFKFSEKGSGNEDNKRFAYFQVLLDENFYPDWYASSDDNVYVSFIRLFRKTTNSEIAEMFGQKNKWDNLVLSSNKLGRK